MCRGFSWGWGRGIAVLEAQVRAVRRGFVLCKGRSMLGAFPLGVEPGISLLAGEVTQGELLAGSLGALGWGMQWKWGIRR